MLSDGDRGLFMSEWRLVARGKLERIEIHEWIFEDMYKVKTTYYYSIHICEISPDKRSL